MEGIAQQITVGVFTALAAALINQALVGNINYWLVIGVFTGAIILYSAYRRFAPFSISKFYVKRNGEVGKELMPRMDLNPGELIDDRWQFTSIARDWAVYGPYLEKIRPGRYRATFRLKINRKPRDNPWILDLSVASSAHKDGDKELAKRCVTAEDFKKHDEPQDFTLDFLALTDEKKLEFRMFVAGTGK